MSPSDVNASGSKASTKKRGRPRKVVEEIAEEPSREE